jgi:hypothetical protein
MEDRLVLNREKKEMKKLLITTILFVVTMTVFASCYASRVDGPYRGRVIDADTRKPIQGVVVLGTWYKVTVTPGGGVSRYYDAAETVTDKNGEFEVKGLGLLRLRNIEPMHVLIFKAGYEYIGSGAWVGLRSVGWEGREEIYDPRLKRKVSMPVFDQKRKVTWDGDRAIIPLRKVTMEERKKDPLYPPMPPSESPLRKVALMIREINKDLVRNGFAPMRTWRGDKI